MRYGISKTVAKMHVVTYYSIFSHVYSSAALGGGGRGGGEEKEKSSSYIPYSAISVNYMSWTVHEEKISHVLSTVPESQSAKYGHK